MGGAVWVSWCGGVLGIGVKSIGERRRLICLRGGVWVGVKFGEVAVDGLLIPVGWTLMGSSGVGKSGGPMWLSGVLGGCLCLLYCFVSGS